MKTYKSRKMKCSPLMVMFGILVLVTGGCAATALPSKWSGEEVFIDGHDTEWDGAKSFYDKDFHLVMGFLNDENNLYVRLSTTDINLQSSLLRSGCTVWVDAKGGKGKSFGIHFPIKIQLDSGRRSNQRSQKPPNDDLNDNLTPNQQALEIVADEGKKRTLLGMSDANGLGIEADIEITRGYLIYELKIPFGEVAGISGSNMSNLLKTVGVGIEIEAIKKNGRAGSGKAGGGGRGSGGRGYNGGRGNRGPEPKGSLEKWFEITLSQAPV